MAGGFAGGGGTGIYPDGTHIYVVDKTVNQLEQWAGYAETWAASATNSLTQISDAATAALGVSDLVAQFVPSLPNYSIGSPSDPSLPTMGSVTAVNTGTAPSLSVTTTDGPGVLTTDAVVIPELSALSLPTFTSTIPTITLDELVAEYSYSEPTYEELLKTTATTQISSVLGGEKVISDAVFDGIYDRKKGEAARTKLEDEWAAQNYAASLSMTGMSSEALQVRLQRATDNYSRAVSAVAIEQATQESIQRREDMWQALGQALAWETLWINHHEALAGRALATAGKAHEALVATYNANVARWNLLIAATDQEVAAGRLTLDIALAPLQEYQSKLNGTAQEIAIQDLSIRKWLGEWDGWKSEKGIEIQAGNQQISLYENSWQADAARHSGDISAQQLVVSDIQQKLRKFEIDWSGINTQASFHLEDNRVELDRAWKNFQAYLGDFKVKLDLTLGVTKDLASYQVGGLQAYLQAANFSMGTSAPSSVSYGYSGDTTDG